MVKPSQTTPASRLFDHWRQCTGQHTRHLEPWIRQHVENLLARCSEEKIARAITRATDPLSWAQKREANIARMLRTASAVEKFAAQDYEPPLKALAGERQRGYRIALCVPYADKDAAKKAGAKWDSAERVWYTDDPEAAQRFLRWMPKHLQEKHGAIPQAPSSVLRKLIENQLDAEGYDYRTRAFAEELSRRLAITDRPSETVT